MKSATIDCLNNIIDSIVTLPISKEALNYGGYNFQGHTEMISHYTDGSPLMILMVDKVINNSLKRMKVALVTSHIPLLNVSVEINKILKIKLEILYYSLIQDFGIDSPRISVLGLNPHSGENGSFGNEELQIINPIIDRLKSEGKLISGPFPADGFFARYNPLNQDAILAMYHDQGLIPLKMYSGHTGVNFTAGLSIIRTSPDHGTAFNIAGENLADPQSTIESVLSNIKIVKNRKLFSEINYKQNSL
ncbi:MAG: 4-hydroxythreonine-4-phosphate dehydrogenase PdxA [Chlorobi bacterium]|nr:4-hydroxythreonine-4-phosphate dehydrogenase PdxA [Chlorobiota bacterium]